MSISDIRKGLDVSYDEDTHQWYVYNDATPGVYGLGDSKKEALQLYVEVLRESIVLDFSRSYLYETTV